MEITVLHNQSLFDVAIQHTGNVMNAFAIAQENALSITSVLVSGSRLVIPAEAEFNRDVKNYYTTKRIMPATGITDTKLLAQAKRGIGFMKITDGTQESDGFISS